MIKPVSVLACHAEYAAAMTNLVVVCWPEEKTLVFNLGNEDFEETFYLEFLQDEGDTEELVNAVKYLYKNTPIEKLKAHMDTVLRNLNNPPSPVRCFREQMLFELLNTDFEKTSEVLKARGYGFMAEKFVRKHRVQKDLGYNYPAYKGPALT